MNTSLEPRISTHTRKFTSKPLFTEPKTTPVILVCIYNRGNSLITHDFLYRLFSPHGRVLRVTTHYYFQVRTHSFTRSLYLKNLMSGNRSLSILTRNPQQKPEKVLTMLRFSKTEAKSVFICPISRLSSSRIIILEGKVNPIFLRFLTKIDYTIQTDNPRTPSKSTLRMNSTENFENFDIFLQAELSKANSEGKNQLRTNGN